MATSNIPLVQTANTFDEWRIATNQLIGSANTLNNGDFVKDYGNITLSDGSIFLSNAVGTHLTVAGNATVSDTATITHLIVTDLNFIGDPVSLAAKISNASNTVRVSQNSSSSLSARQLNFVNTASVTVSVESGSPSGNANVAFSIVGGVSQGTTGVQGTRGSQGIQGTVGTGTQGTSGVTGSGTQGTTGTDGSQGATGTSITGAQGTTGSSGSSGAQYLHHVTSGYTGSGKVLVDASTPASGNTQGDIWLDISTMGLLASPGWTKLGNGLKIAWGITGTPSSEVPFSTSYASGVSFTTVYGVQLTAINSGGTIGADTWSQLTDYTSSTTAFTSMSNHAAGSTYFPSFYIAIGV